MTTDREASRRLLHHGVLLGLSTATYAAALAAVAGLQSADDQAAIAARQPSVDAIATLARRNDALAARLDRAAADYSALAAGYGPMAERITGLETEIDALAGVVAKVDRTASSLPSRVAIVRSVKSAPAASRPTTHATTGASGAR